MCRTVDSSCLGSVRTAANFQFTRVIGSHIKTRIHITPGTFLDSISIAVCTCSASSIGTGTDLETAGVVVVCQEISRIARSTLGIAIIFTICALGSGSITTATDLELASVIFSLVETVKTRETFKIAVRAACRTRDSGSVHAAAFLEVAQSAVVQVESTVA